MSLSILVILAICWLGSCAFGDWLEPRGGRGVLQPSAAVVILFGAVGEMLGSSCWNSGNMCGDLLMGSQQLVGGCGCYWDHIWYGDLLGIGWCGRVGSFMRCGFE